MNLPVMICEIGCNHRGDMDTAQEMIEYAAQFCKVDVVKFQKRFLEQHKPTEILDIEQVQRDKLKRGHETSA